MTRKEIVFLFMGSVVGFGLGTIGWVHLFSPPAMNKGAVGVGQVDRLRAENAELRGKLADTEKKLRSAATEKSIPPQTTTEQLRQPKDVISRLKILTNAHRLGVRTGFSVISRKGELDNAFCEIFGLSDEERAILNESVQTARAALGKLQVSNSTREVLANGDVVVSTHSFPKAGGDLYDETLAEFSDTLGPERNAAFLDLCAEDLEKGMDDFGAAERKVTVSAEPKKAGWYSVKVDSRKPESSSSSSMEFNNQAAIANQIGAVSELLPPISK